MSSNSVEKAIAPKRRRMLDMILALGGLKEESAIPVSKVKEEVANLSRELAPFTDDILSFPELYFDAFLEAIESSQLINDIKDKKVLREAVDNVEKALFQTRIEALGKLNNLLKTVLEEMEVGDQVEEVEAAVDIDSTMKPIPQLVSTLESKLDKYETKVRSDAEDASAQLESLTEAILKIESDLASNPESTLDSLQDIGIKTRYGRSPCHVTCPAGVNGQGFVTLLREGRFNEALDIVRHAIPFPGVLGRVCNHPCEEKCERGQVDQPVSIRNLHRFLADYERAKGRAKSPKQSRAKDSRIAVIGAGPAGIGCAYDLARRGYPITIYEAAPESGGLLRYGIPEYRLPRAVLQEEVDRVVQLGVEIVNNHRVTSIGGLLEEGYKAVFVATGNSSSRKMRIEGEDTPGVLHAIEFLRGANTKEAIPLGKRVAVIGGGNAAIDSARMALRLGANQVTIVYRRSREEMPAISSEIEEAEHEQVELVLLSNPTKILESNGKVSGMRCIRMKLGDPDESGRRRPIPIPDSEFDIELDNVIVAIGQEIRAEDYFSELAYTQWGLLDVDSMTLQTNMEGVFAGGDAVTGPATAVDAVASGKKAARSIIRYLQGDDLSAQQPEQKPMVASAEADKTSVQTSSRAVMPMIEAENRGETFEEVELGLDEAIAVTESERCLCCSVWTASQIKRQINDETLDESVLMRSLIENLLVELRRGVITFILDNMGSKSVLQLSELMNTDSMEVQKAVVTMMQKREVEMVGLYGDVPMFSRVFESTPATTTTVGQTVLQAGVLAKSLAGESKELVDTALTKLKSIFKRLQILGQYDETTLKKPTKKLGQAIDAATEAVLSSQAADTSDDLRLLMSASLEAFTKFRLNLALEKGPNLVSGPNVYGEKLDPEIYESMLSNYLDSELERGMILVLIRELGSMTAKDLAEKTNIRQDRILQHLLRMKRDELLISPGESHGYLLYDVPRTPTEAEITIETSSAIALQFTEAKSELETLLSDLKAEDIGKLANALDTFSKGQDKLTKIMIDGSIVGGTILAGVEDKIRSAVSLVYRTRAKIPSTRPKVTLEDLTEVDVPSVLDEYKTMMGYAPLLGFGTIEWEQSKCLGCKSCEIACPEDAVELKPVLQVSEFFDISDEALENLPVNRALFYRTVKSLAVQKPVEDIFLTGDSPGFGTVEVDLWLCVACRTCVRRCPGPGDGALELELKWNLPEVVRQITTQN